MPYDHQKTEEALLGIVRQTDRLEHFLTRRRVQAPPFRLRNGVESLRALRVAAIMDPFTLLCYRPECTLLELSVDGYAEEIRAFEPDLVLIESAWHGKEGGWYRKVSRMSPQMQHLAGYCRGLGIPLVFWNKEDPVFTTQFLYAARLCDVVFTADADCIIRYNQALGHNRVYHLPFAAQPTLHNPVEQFDRKNRICFAGAYYSRYPERARVMDAFTEYFAAGIGIDLYDRNHGDAGNPNAFPAWYEPYILGKLAPEDIAVAYKGYAYGLTMNSIPHSQTMMARRVFELLASNTVVVGNFSRAVRNYFGDLTISTDNVQTLDRLLSERCPDEAARHRYRLPGLRSVLSEHLYEDRLDQIVQTVFGVSLKPAPPPAYVLADAASPARDGIVRQFDAQIYPNRHLLWCDSGSQVRLPEEAGFFAVFDERDQYGPQYLSDLLLSTRYSTADGFTKPQGLHDAYHPTDMLWLRRGVARGAIVQGRPFDGLGDAPLQGTFQHTDPFHYRADSADAPTGDPNIARRGIPLDLLISNEHFFDGSLRFGAKEMDAQALYEHLRLPEGVPVQTQPTDTGIAIESRLADGEVCHIASNRKHWTRHYEDLGRIHLQMDAPGTVDATGICWFFDRNSVKIGAAFFALGTEQSVPVPHMGAKLMLGLRICGSGECLWQSARLGWRDTVGFGKYFQRGPAIVMTNLYPAPDNLYRNMFVHRRLLSYRDDGLWLDVLRLAHTDQKWFREFEDVDVLEGDRAAFHRMMLRPGITTVCVHFFDHYMWSALRPHLDRLRVIIWCHGADVQPWWRRTCNYRTEEELQDAKEKSAIKERIWPEVFEAARTHDIHFVFVSAHFAREVMEDYQVQLPPSMYSVIHNVVDTGLFTYAPKDPAQRTRLLSIRPYTALNYANDLTVQCILALSEKPYFQELSFLLIGDGPLFDEITAPLAGFANVTLRKAFLDQHEIAALHKDYGIFLTPTRLDTQGVSRDEAMASGLVPVTNAAGAVAEFVDDSCAILALPEDYAAMADGIDRLYHDPALFARMSQNAAQRVRRQSGWNETIGRELRLIRERL